MLNRKAFLIGAGASLAAWPGFAAAKSKVGQPAPPFTVTTFDRRPVHSDELKGKVVVLNFWATWCAPCRNEMLVMDSYMRRHRDQGLEVFAVATEDSVPDRYLKPLAAALSFPLVKSMRARGYGIIDGAVPTSYVIDRAGVIRHAAAGAFDARGFAELITPLLAEAAPADAAAAAT